MKDVYFKGGDMFMGNGLICREPGVYETTDEFAAFLLENHSDQFEAANEDHDEEDSQSSAGDESEDAGEQQDSPMGDGGNVDPEEDVGHVATQAKDGEGSSDDKSVAPTDEGMKAQEEAESTADSNESGDRAPAERSDVDKPVAPTDEGLRTDGETDDAGVSEGPEGPEEESESSEPSKPLSKMSKAKLEAVADEIGAKVNPDEMTADQMREAIKSHQAS